MQGKRVALLEDQRDFPRNTVVNVLQTGEQLEVGLVIDGRLKTFQVASSLVQEVSYGQLQQLDPWPLVAEEHQRGSTFRVDNPGRLERLGVTEGMLLTLTQVNLTPDMATDLFELQAGDVVVKVSGNFLNTQCTRYNYQQGSRVRLITELDVDGKLIPRGTYATVIRLQEDLLQLGYIQPNHSEGYLDNVKVNQVECLTDADVIRVHPELLLDPVFRVGSTWISSGGRYTKGTQATLLRVEQLMPNALDDVFIVNINGQEQQLSCLTFVSEFTLGATSQVENILHLDPVPREEPATKIPEVPTMQEVPNVSNAPNAFKANPWDGVELTGLRVGGYDFTITNGVVTQPTEVNVIFLPGYVRALEQLYNLLIQTKPYC